MLRRVKVLLLAAVLLIAAFSTGAIVLFFLVYLGALVVGGSYLLTRIGLADLEAGYVLDRLHAHAGDALRATYTVRNTSRLPKPWLEAYNPTTLPVAIPGRALSLTPRGERSWSARVPLTRRGHYRVDPLVLRTGDPFGLFESSATVGSHSNVIVYPRVDELPAWRLPPAAIEGTHAHPLRTPHTTPHATSIRPYAPGDAYNRIHWKSSARHVELQVKEFDLEQTADVWIYLDLDAAGHTGDGDESTLEYGVRAAASIAAQALLDGRALGMTASGARRLVLPADRGPRQYQKVMHLLAAVEGDGNQPMRDVLIDGVSRLRRGMTALVITPSLERDWIRPLVTLRGRGVTTLVVLPDAPDFARHAPGSEDWSDAQRASRALHHALAEHDVPAYPIRPGKPLAVQLASTQRRSMALAR